ncbi:MAG: GNAT family N-acetyltransferase [Fluviicola sp.]
MHFKRIQQFPTLESERLILRPFTLEDVEEWYVIHQDPEVTRYTGDGGVISKEEVKRRIKDHVLADYVRHGFGRWVVVHKEDNCLIGFTGLKYIPEMKVVDLGYRFARKYWGQGIATEACKKALDFGFNDLKLDRVKAYIIPANIGSQKVLEKLEFEFVRELYEEGELEHEYALSSEKYFNSFSH